MKQFILYIFALCVFLLPSESFSQTYTAQSLGIEGSEGKVSLPNGKQIRTSSGSVGADTTKQLGTKNMYLTAGFAYPVSYFSQVFSQDFFVSKGYFSEYVELRWDILSSSDRIDQLLIFRKPLGSPQDSIRVASLPSDARSYRDEFAEKGVLYKYTVYAKGVQSVPLRDEFVSFIDGVGFATATGSITGKITYEGGIAVEGVQVAAETNGDLGGKSLYLNGTDAYLSLPHNVDNGYLALEEGFTIQLWNRMEGSNSATLFSKGNGVYKLSYDGVNEKLVFDVMDGRVELPFQVRQDTFFHISAVFDKSASELRLYAIYNDDSIYTAAASSATLPTANNDNLFFGKDFTNTGFYQGYLDEIRLWQKPLALETIKL